TRQVGALLVPFRLPSELPSGDFGLPRGRRHARDPRRELPGVRSTVQVLDRASRTLQGLRNNATSDSCSAYYLAATIRYFLRSLDPDSRGILPLFPISRELVGYVQGRQDGDFCRVDRGDLSCHLSHPGVHKPRKLRQIVGVSVS